MGKVTILDGGLSTQIEKYVGDPIDGDPLWTARCLKEHPDDCTKVHRDFAVAGSEIISTFSYQASLSGFKQYLGMEEKEARELIKHSVKLAREGIWMAELESGKQLNHVRVAGSIGPYGASLHDGSEYTGSYCEKLTTEEFIAWHRPRMEALIEGGVDLVGIETIPCLKEALALINLLKEYPHVSAWISFSIKDANSLSSGENFCESAMKIWNESNQLLAIGANCFHPSLAVALLSPLISKCPEIPKIIYPGNGDFYDSENGKWVDKNVSIEDFVPAWLDLGISYIGGCCRTRSQDISKINTIWQQWENKRSN